jgi:HEAT repeat protein
MRRTPLFAGVILALSLSLPELMAQSSIKLDKAIAQLAKKDQKKKALKWLEGQGPFAAPGAARLLELFGQSESLDEDLARLLEGMGCAVVPLLSSDLDSAKGPRFVGLVRALGGLGLKARPAFLKLLANASHRDVRRRLETVRALGHFPSEQMTPALIVALKDRQRELRFAAVHSLGQLGVYGRGAAPALLTALTTRDPKYQAKIALTLAAIGPTSPELLDALIRLLKSESSLVKAAALRALGCLGHHAEGALKEIGEALTDSDEAVVLEAINALQFFGARASNLRPTLKTLFQKHRHWRLPILTVLIRSDPWSSFGFYEVLAMAPREGPDFRRQLVRLLGEAGPRSNIVVAELLKFAERDPALEVRREAISALGLMPARDNKNIIDRLSKLCAQDKDELLKDVLLPALRRHGPRKKSIRLILIRELKQRSFIIKEIAARELILCGWRGLQHVVKAADSEPEDMALPCLLALAKNQAVKPASIESRERWARRLVNMLAKLPDSKKQLALTALYSLEMKNPGLGKLLKPYLNHPRDNLRLSAYKALYYQTEQQQSALIRGLRDSDERVRRVVIRTLGRSSSSATKGMIKLLTAALSDDPVKFAAAAALIRLTKGQSAGRGRRILELASGQADVRALASLRRLGPLCQGSASELVKNRRFPDPRYRRALARTLAALGGSKSQKGLLSMLDDSSAAVRASVVLALGQFGTLKQAALEQKLVALLGDHHLMVRTAVIEVLGKYGSSKARLLLLEQLKADWPELRDHAARSIATLGRDSFAPLEKYFADKESLPWAEKVIARADPSLAAEIVKHYKDQDWKIREAVARGLGQCPRAVIARLLPLLREPDRRLRAIAREALAWQGEDAILPLLKEVTRGHERSLESAAIALRLIGVEAVLPLISLMRQESVRARRFGARALGIVGPLNSRVASTLLSALEDKDTRVRAEAAAALGICVSPAQRDLIISALLRALKDSSKRVRVKAVMSIGNIGPDAAVVAIPPLKNCLKSWDRDIRRESALALGKMGPKAHDCVPLFISALKDQDETVRQALVETLGAFGKAAKTSLPCLQRLARDDPSLAVKMAASLAAEKIKGR